MPLSRQIFGIIVEFCAFLRVSLGLASKYAARATTALSCSGGRRAKVTGSWVVVADGVEEVISVMALGIVDDELGQAGVVSSCNSCSVAVVVDGDFCRSMSTVVLISLKATIFLSFLCPEIKFVFVIKYTATRSNHDKMWSPSVIQIDVVVFCLCCRYPLLGKGSYNCT